MGTDGFGLLCGPEAVDLSGENALAKSAVARGFFLGGRHGILSPVRAPCSIKSKWTPM